MKVGQIHREKIGALIFLMFSIAYGALSQEIEIPFFAQEDFFTSRTMPFALAFLGGITSFLLLVLPSVGSEEDHSLRGAFRDLRWSPVIQLLLLMVVYGLTIKVVGFIFSTIVFLCLGFWILGERRPKVIFAASVPLVVGFWYVLSELLDIYIDPGSIFHFLGSL